jgi:hypothetical protein
MSRGSGFGKRCRMVEEHQIRCLPWLLHHAVDRVPGEAVELHEVVDLLLGGSEQGRVRGVLGAAVLKMVHRQLLATFVQKTIFGCSNKL